MTDVTPELLARLRDLAAKWPTTIVVEADVVAALVAEVERLRGVVGRDGVDGHPCIRVEAYIDLLDRLAAAEGALRGPQEATTAPLSPEQGASGQGGDHPDEFEAWIGRAMIGEEQGWGA